MWLFVAMVGWWNGPLLRSLVVAVVALAANAVVGVVVVDVSGFLLGYAHCFAAAVAVAAVSA